MPTKDKEAKRKADRERMQEKRGATNKVAPKKNVAPARREEMSPLVRPFKPYSKDDQQRDTLSVRPGVHRKLEKAGLKMDGNHILGFTKSTTSPAKEDS